MEKTKRKSFLMILALIFILPFAFFLTACGGSKDPEPEVVTVTYNLTSNGDLYTIESNDTINGFRISVQHGESLSANDVMFQVYVNGNLVAAQDYTVTSNLPTTPLEWGSDYLITYTYGEEQQNVVVTVTEFEIDFSNLGTLSYSYSEIDNGSGEYIDIIDKIDDILTTADASYTLSGLKQQGAVQFEEATLEYSQEGKQFTRTYHANLLDVSEFQKYEFEINTNNGYTIKTNDGLTQTHLIVYWQVLPVFIDMPSATNTTFTFNPTQTQAPTLVFSADADENTKFNSMIDVTKQFKADLYSQIEYNLKNEFKRNYKLLSNNQEIVDIATLWQPWTISRLVIPKATLYNRNAEYYVYDGNEKQPGWVLPTGYSYLFANPSYSNNVEVGIATMHVELVTNRSFTVDGLNYYLSGDDLYGCFAWEDDIGAPISDYDINFEITQATYSLPDSVVNKSINLTYDDINTALDLIDYLNDNPSVVLSADTYSEWYGKDMLNYGYQFYVKNGDSTSINTKLRIIGTHTITLLYTPNTYHYSNTVEIEFTLNVAKRQHEVYDLTWSNSSYSSDNYNYKFDGTEKAAPTCTLNYNDITGITYLAVEENGNWVADKAQSVEQPTNAGKYITIVSLVRDYDEYVYDGHVLTEVSSPVWEIKKQQLNKYNNDDQYPYYLGSYSSTNIESYNFEGQYYFGLFATGNIITIDYNTETKNSISHYDYFIKTTNTSGYAVSYEVWDETDNEWRSIVSVVNPGLYRVCFTFDLDPNYIFIDYDADPDNYKLTDKQYFAFEIYATTYSATGWTLTTQTEYEYTGDDLSSSPKVETLPHGLIVTYVWYNDIGGSTLAYTQHPTEIGTYYIKARIEPAQISNNVVSFVDNESNTTTFAETDVKEYSIVKKQINKNEISVRDISGDSSYSQWGNYYNIPENASYSTYIFNSTVVIEDDNNNIVADGQYFEPLTHYTMTVTLKLYDWQKDHYTLVDANENDEFVYTFDWTTGKFMAEINSHWEDNGQGNHQVFDTFDFVYDTTLASLPTITNLSYKSGLPASITNENWKEVFDVTFIYSVWDSEEEYQQGSGTTTLLDASDITESGRHYICEMLFSIKPEYQDRYEMVDYLKSLHFSWTKP